LLRLLGYVVFASMVIAGAVLLPVGLAKDRNSAESESSETTLNITFIPPSSPPTVMPPPSPAVPPPPGAPLGGAPLMGLVAEPPSPPRLPPPPPPSPASPPPLLWLTPEVVVGDDAAAGCAEGSGSLYEVCSLSTGEAAHKLLETSGIKQAWVAAMLNETTEKLFTNGSLANYNDTHCTHYHTSFTSAANRTGALAQRGCDAYFMHALCVSGSPADVFEASSLYALHESAGLPFLSYSYSALYALSW